MKDIKIIDNEINYKFNYLVDNYVKNLSAKQLMLIKTVIVRFKENSLNEYYVYLIFLFWLFYFKLIRLDLEIISDLDRENIKKILTSYNADINWEFKTYIYEMLDYDEDLFLVKIIIKYTLLNGYEWFLKPLSSVNLTNYYKSIWYLIPVLTFKESSFLAFYQDFYFKKMYPLEFKRIKRIHLRQTSKFELPWLYLINKINNLNMIMKHVWVYGVISLRKKSYFSIFWKYNRKANKKVADYLWIRIIFENIDDLVKFQNTFESTYILLDKKDYINEPKDNWYKSIHYSYLTAFRTSQILVELQIRTIEMDNIIKTTRSLTHFTYTVKQNKWDPLFKEIYEGYGIMKDYLKDRNLID